MYSSAVQYLECSVKDLGCSSMLEYLFVMSKFLNLILSTRKGDRGITKLHLDAMTKENIFGAHTSSDKTSLKTKLQD